MNRGSAYSIQSENLNHHQVEKSFQIALVGDIEVGKSSILSQFVDNMFTTQILTTKGIDMRFKKLIINQYLVKLRVWDTSGSEILKSIKEGYLKNIDAIMLIFDLSQENSLQKLKLWNKQIDNYIKDKKTKLSKLLIGNKSDLPHSKEISFEAKKYGEKNSMMYFETSAKTNHLILDSFIYLVKDLLNQKQIIRTSRSVEIDTQNKDTLCRCNCSKI